MGTYVDMTDKKSIGLAVKYWRHKAGLTQEALVKRINPKTKSKNTISRIERGESNYTIDRLFKIAEILGCDVADFFTFEKKPMEAKSIDKVFEEFKNKVMEEVKEYKK